MKDYYAARAQEYDKIYLKPERQQDLREIEAWLPAKFTQRATLEIAAGTGYWTQFLIKTVQSLVALDAASETFQVARSRLGDAADQVRWVIGDAYDLPQPATPYEAAFAGFWFSHVPLARQREFLNGLNKVLKPGAKVVLLDNLYVEGSSTAISELDAEGNTYQIRVLADGSEHCVLKNFPTDTHLCELIEGVGSNPVFTRWQYFWAFEYTVL